MFDKLIRELRKLGETKSISVPLKADVDGYLDKECPADGCRFNFKVLEEDWANIVRDEEVFCPSCRHAAPAKSWFTRDQIEGAREYAIGSIKAGINRAMREDAAAFNRRQKKTSFISMSLEVKGGQIPALVSVAAGDPMRMRTQCEGCQCRYSYIGAAFFCPSCGLNSVEHTFAQTLSSIRTITDLEATLRSTLGRDESEVAVRLFREKAMQDTVTCFQRLAEQLYARKPGAPAARRNAFQNLEAGSKLWEAATGYAYQALTDAQAIAKLTRYFQQRHLLAHQQGMVDQDYIDRSGDSSYAVGQRLVISDHAVREFSDLVERLGGKLLSSYSNTPA